MRPAKIKSSINLAILTGVTFFAERLMIFLPALEGLATL